MDIPAKYVDDVSPALVAAIGFVMLVFPEPATSAFGAVLLLFGAAWWFYEWGRDPADATEQRERRGDRAGTGPAGSERPAEPSRRRD